MCVWGGGELDLYLQMQFVSICAWSFILSFSYVNGYYVSAAENTETDKIVSFPSWKPTLKPLWKRAIWMRKKHLFQNCVFSSLLVKYQWNC